MSLLQQRLHVGHFVMQHNLVLGFLHAREEAVEMVPTFIGETGVQELDVDFQVHVAASRLFL